MERALKTGISFGLSSVVITILGSIVGINASTASRLAVIGVIIMIAIADAGSDALGIHISEESDKNNTSKQVWISTISTLVTKFLVAITFLVPVLLLPLNQAIIYDIVWGFILIFGISFYIAYEQKKNATHVIAEHVGIAIAIVIITNYVGGWIGSTFNSV